MDEARQQAAEEAHQQEAEAHREADGDQAVAVGQDAPVVKAGAAVRQAVHHLMMPRAHRLMRPWGLAQKSYCPGNTVACNRPNRHPSMY